MKKYTHLLGDIGEARLRLLRIFKVVVDCNGFTAAEAELNISRSAISIAIADLEDYLGFTLCQRGRSGFSLTEEGVCVYDSILQLFAAMDSFKTQLNDLHSQLRGELNIGITDNLVTMPHMHLTNALGLLKQDNEQVKINIRMMSPIDIELQVLDNRLHIGVIPELKLISGLEYTPLYDEECLLYCSAEHPLFAIDNSDISSQLLQEHDAVLPSYAPTPEVQQLYQCLKEEASASDREGVAFLLLTGRFIGFLPTHYAQRWVETKKMRALQSEKMRYITRYSAIKSTSGRPNLVRDTYLQLLSQLVN